MFASSYIKGLAGIFFSNNIKKISWRCPFKTNMLFVAARLQGTQSVGQKMAVLHGSNKGITEKVAKMIAFLQVQTFMVET